MHATSWSAIPSVSLTFVDQPDSLKSGLGKTDGSTSTSYPSSQKTKKGLRFRFEHQSFTATLSNGNSIGYPS
jgi:hypothetical protein